MGVLRCTSQSPFSDTCSQAFWSGASRGEGTGEPLLTVGLHYKGWGGSGRKGWAPRLSTPKVSVKTTWLPFPFPRSSGHLYSAWGSGRPSRRAHFW